MRISIVKGGAGTQFFLCFYLDGDEQLALKNSNNRFRRVNIKGCANEGFKITADDHGRFAITHGSEGGTPYVRVPVGDYKAVPQSVSIFGIGPAKVSQGVIVTGPLPEKFIRPVYRTAQKPLADPVAEAPVRKPINVDDLISQAKALRDAINDNIINAEILIDELNKAGLNATYKITPGHGIEFSVEQTVTRVVEEKKVVTI